MPATDLSILISNSMGDEAFVREIVQMAAEQMAAQLRDLRDLCVDGPSDAWVAKAHALKGSAATLGAEDLRALCATAQKDLGDTTASARLAMLREIEVSYDAVRASLTAQGYLS